MPIAACCAALMEGIGRFEDRELMIEDGKFSREDAKTLRVFGPGGFARD
jgi:hypothetical protein